ASTGCSEAKGKQRLWQAVVRVDATAIRRGHCVSGEVCEVVGVGPIDVDSAIRLLGESTVRLMIKDGRDVLSMATVTPSYPKSLALAVAEKADWVCSNRGCSNVGYIENDHNNEFHKTHDSSYCNLWPLCSRCHHLKTYDGYRVFDHGDGSVSLLAPDEP